MSKSYQLTPWLDATLDHALPAVILLAAVGCGDSATDDVDSTTPGTNPALLVAVIVEKPEDRNVYVGAVPEVPEGELDYSNLELRPEGVVSRFTVPGLWGFGRIR